MAADERWVFGHALNVESPTQGVLSRSTLYGKLTLKVQQQNWLLAAVPTPNVTEGWRVSAVMVRYVIKNSSSGGGLIDKVGLRDGENTVHEFANLTAGAAPTWQTLTLTMPSPAPFKFGLGVSIHASNVFATDPPPNAIADIEIVGVGLRFVR